ncbi:response regulator receiver protein [Hylemonella gracilis ATCC 19624]|uniref:Response regulator receiver protein n=2 Tax=Hylemonella gracilis TaxID=80880 RepID=F3KTT8_9BURK|nr:response regulator receiver protein [Hylemonella gracilis ATCC 19624]
MVRLGTMTVMKILVVDDSEHIRLRLSWQVGAIPGLEQVWVALTGIQAQKLLTRMKPALLVLEPQLSDGDPVHLIPLFKSTHADLKVAVLTDDATGHSRQRCLQAGADWFFDKSTEFTQLLDLIHQLSDASLLTQHSNATVPHGGSHE